MISAAVRRPALGQLERYTTDWASHRAQPGEVYDITYYSPGIAASAAQFRDVLRQRAGIQVQSVERLTDHGLLARVTIKTAGTLGTLLGRYLIAGSAEHEARVADLISRASPITSPAPPASAAPANGAGAAAAGDGRCSGFLDCLRYWFSPFDWRVLEDTKDQMRDDISASIAATVRPLIVPALIIGGVYVLSQRRARR